MARGKYLSLEEARRDPKLLERFCKEHPSKADKERLEVPGTEVPGTEVPGTQKFRGHNT